MTTAIPRVCEHPDTLHVFTDGDFYFIACCPRDAARIFNHTFRFSSEPMITTESRWTQCADESDFTYDAPQFGAITKTFGEWARQDGRGYFASTGY